MSIKTTVAKINKLTGKTYKVSSFKNAAAADKALLKAQAAAMPKIGDQPTRSKSAVSLYCTEHKLDAKVVRARLRRIARRGKIASYKTGDWSGLTTAKQVAAALMS